MILSIRAASLLPGADKYHLRGLDFDEAWGWEAAGVDAEAFWASVPPDVTPKLHFYNTYVSECTQLRPNGIEEHMCSALLLCICAVPGPFEHSFKPCCWLQLITPSVASSLCSVALQTELT